MKKLLLQLLVVSALIGTQIQASVTFIDKAGTVCITNESLSNNTILNTDKSTTFNTSDKVLLSPRALTHKDFKSYGTETKIIDVFNTLGEYLQVTFSDSKWIVVNEYDAYNKQVNNYNFKYTGSTPPSLYIHPSQTVSRLKITLTESSPTSTTSTTSTTSSYTKRLPKYPHSLAPNDKISLILDNRTGKSFTLHQHSYATGSLNTDVLPVTGSTLNLIIGEQYFLLLSDGSKIFIKPTASNSIDSYVLSSAVFNAGTMTKPYKYSKLTIVPDSTSTYAIQAK